jgi:hypothetical protein
MKRSILYITLALLLFQCQKEVIIDIPGFEEQLVIDGRIETGQPPLVLLSRSKNIYAPTDIQSYLNGFVSGATVTVSDGTTTVQLVEICSDNLPPGAEIIASELFGIPVSQLASYHLCAYTTLDPTIWGQVGKTYALIVSFEGKTYTAETSILPPTPLVNTFWKHDGNLLNYGYSWATLADPSGTYDAYRWDVKRINHNPDGSTKDLAFTPTYNPVFDDQFFNGLTFEFFFENPMSFDDESVAGEYKGYYVLGDTVVIKLSKMDRKVYDFLEKKYVQVNSGGSPFASPTNIPSNISGGALGVWAGYSPAFDTLICTE